MYSSESFVIQDIQAHHEAKRREIVEDTTKKIVALQLWQDTRPLEEEERQRLEDSHRKEARERTNELTKQLLERLEQCTKEKVHFCSHTFWVLYRIDTFQDFKAFLEDFMTAIRFAFEPTECEKLALPWDQGVRTYMDHVNLWWAESCTNGYVLGNFARFIMGRMEKKMVDQKVEWPSLYLGGCMPRICTLSTFQSEFLNFLRETIVFDLFRRTPSSMVDYIQTWLDQIGHTFEEHAQRCWEVNRTQTTKPSIPENKTHFICNQGGRVYTITDLVDVKTIAQYLEHDTVRRVQNLGDQIKRTIWGKEYQSGGGGYYWTPFNKEEHTLIDEDGLKQWKEQFEDQAITGYLLSGSTDRLRGRVSLHTEKSNKFKLFIKRLQREDKLCSRAADSNEQEHPSKRRKMSDGLKKVIDVIDLTKED
jgi:hypothetical protein